MRLIVGGRASGKLGRVQALGYGMCDIYDGAQGLADEAFARPVLYNLQELVRDVMQNGGDPSALLQRIVEGGTQVVVCDEVGAGIVPVDRFERDWREAVGRLCCALAREAQIVERVCCGIPTVIKSDEA